MAKSDDILKKYGVTQVKGSEGSSNKAATTTSNQKTTGTAKADAILAKYGITQGASAAKGSTITGNKSTDSRYHDIITANDYAANSRYKTTKTDNLWEKMWSQYGMGYSDLTYEYVNNHDGIRDEVKRKSSIYKSDSPFSDDEVTYEEKGYDFMTEEEIGVYNYYYNKEGKERAQAFLDSLEDTLVKRKAGKEFTNLDGSIGKEYLYGIVAGAEQFTSGVENIGDFITGDKGSTPSSQYVSEMIRQDLADDGPKVLGSSVGQIGYDIINTTSNMLPSILVGAVTGPVGGAVAMGGSVVGNSYQEMLRLGYNTNQARAYAALTGASEATLQYLLGGISKLGGKLSGNVVSKLVSKVDNAIARVAIDLGGNMISEGVEESVQTVLEPVFKALVTGEDFEGVDIEEVLYSGLLGALSAGFLESGGKVAGNTVANLETKQTGKSILESEGSVDALKQLANEVAGVSSADMQKTISDQIAKVDKKQSAIQVGKLYNTVQSANNLANASANQADIAKSLERKGFSAQEAKAAAEAIMAKYNGQELTKAQQKTIKSIKGNEAVRGVLDNIINNPKSTMGQRSDNIRNFNRDVNIGRVAKAHGISTDDVKKIAEGKFITAKENAPESHYEVSTDGQTIDKDGNTVSIQGIASLEKGRMVLKTENGTVDAGDVSYGSQAEALVYEAVSKLEGLIDTDTANRLSKHLLKLGDASSDVYARGIVQAYTYGYYGYGREAMLGENTLSATLTEKQRNVAYGLGEQYRDAKTKVDQAKAENATIQKSAQTGKSTAPDGTQYQKVRFESKVKKWGKKQKAEVAYIDFIASNFSGNTVHVFESYKTKAGNYVYEDSNGKIKAAPNGMYFDSNGDIYLDLNAGNHGEGLIMNTFAHELYHHIQKRSPAKARKLAEFLVQELGYESVDAAVNRQIAKAERGGYGVEFFMKEKGLSRSAAERMVYDRAFNDFVADSLETMFTEGDAVGKLQKLKSQDEGLFNMIKNFIDKWVNKLREFYSGHSTMSVEGSKVASLEKFEQIQQMFVEALVDAGENYQAAEVQKNTTDDGGVEEFSIRRTQKMTLKEQLSEYYNRKFKQSDSFYFGVTPSILSKSGLDSEPLAFGQDDFAKSTRNKHNIPRRVLNKLSDNLAKPIFSFTAGKQAAIVIDDIDGDGKPVVVAIHGGHTMDRKAINVIKSIYGIDSMNEWVTKQIKGGGKFRVYDIEKANAMLQTQGYLAAVGTQSDGFWDIITFNNPTVNTESLTPGKEGTILNQNGDTVAHSTEDGTIQLSMRTYDAEGREAFRKYLQKCVSSKKLTKAEMQDMLDGIEEIYDICKDFKDKYAPFSTWSDAAVVRDTHGKPVFSVVTPNGDYKMNLDFSLVCKKRRTLDAVFNEMSRRGIIDDFELGQKSVVKINEIIRRNGLETACALCFVDAKRFRQASMADQFTRLYNELVESLVPEDQKGNIDHFNFSGYATIKKVEGGIDTWDNSKLDFSHINHVMKTYGDGTVEYKAAKYIKSHAEGRKLLLRGDFMSSQGFDAVKTQNQDILKLYNSKKGTGGPKAAFGDVQYMNEVIQKARWWTPKKAYEVGGIRIQSFSDYVPRMVFDYVQMVYDLAATKLPAHAYTKEALFAKQFGLTGIKINMSLIPAIAEGGIAPGLDANGNYVWAGESFDYETAKEIQNAEGYTENCGTICVGVSYKHILKLLGDPNIRMVIPYHKSGLNPIVAHMNKIAEFTDYTTLKTNPGGCQNTIDKNGSKVEVDFNFNEVLRKTGDPRETVRQYLAWCAKNEYTPRFAEFAWHENYYKLIEDFTLFDKDGNYVPQREVRAVFPKKTDAFGSMKDLIKDGLEEDAIVEGKRDARLSAIVDEIQKTIPKTEAEIAEEQVAQADRDLEADVLLSDRDYGDNAPTFYSQMAKVIDGMKQEKFGASSVVSMLRGKGVKAEEIKWSGIEEWLEGKKSVTRAELQEFIAGSMLQIEEETLTNDEIPYTDDQQKRITEHTVKRDEITQELAEAWRQVTGEEIPITYFGAGLESAVESKIRDVNLEEKKASFEGRLLEKLRKDLKEVIANNDDFGFDSGREALISIHRHRKSFIDHYELSTADKAVIVKYCNALNAYNELPNKINDQDTTRLRRIAHEAELYNRKIGDVKSEHYAENAKHMTKWGQYKLKGGTNYRELLFKIPGSSYYNDAMAMHWEERDGVLAHARIQDLNTFLGKMLFIEEIQSDWHNEGHKEGYTSERDAALDRIAELREQWNSLYNDMLEASVTEGRAISERMDAIDTERASLAKKVRYGNFVPDAPFKDTYHEYVLKRLIREAAENGYDSIGWTPAEIQVKRWSEKFAEGYRIEYDQEIPKFLNKYGKKWGTKVGKTVLDNGTEVWSMAITDEMQESVLTEGQPLYQDRDTESVSNRSLLANAFEGMAQNDIERNKIQEYKSKISLIEAEERKLQELNEKIREMSFSKGPKDTKAIRGLQFEAKQTANRINTYDKQLLRLEASKPLQDVIAREKKVAYQRAEKKGKEALAAYKEKAAKTQRELLNKYQDARKTAVENREKTAMRHKVQNVVKELNDLLLNESKKRHVPDNLKKAVADALALVNMDTVGAEERAAKYAALIARETDPDKIDAYTATMENILRQGDKMGQRLKELRDAYEEIQESDDPDIANAYDPVIAGCLKELSGSIGNTSLRNMTIEQLSDVYDMYKMVLTRVRDANKTLLENIKENISSLASRVIGEVRMTGGEHKYRMAALDPVRKFLWNNLKPVYAMEHMGSSTLTKVFNNVRAGEDTWAKDVTEAREYYLDKAKKYGYNSWDFKKKYRFESASELEFELTLEQILSLYAYSKREQAHDHLRLGGFVFDSNIETYKDKDSKLKYKVNTADAHQITPEILASIIGKLSKEQMAFVDEMQDYLSTVMGAKGNEVTMKMYGVKLFKEKFYFPLKSAKQFMFEQNEVAGEVRIKNSGFTNKVVAKANNPVILSNFMDVWSGHVNDMSMYHSFVLPLEDFNRVFNYNSPKKENQPPVSVKGTIQNAYSPAAVNYVKGLITDLNGGARTDSTTGIINKMMGLFKKGSVFASLSVVVQQPSAIARAAALVDIKYFIGPKVDHKRHKALWDEVKQYAPVAIIKEMGYFDTNMGKSTQDFILGKEYSGFKEKMAALVTDSGYRDEILSKAPALADEIAWCSIWEAVKREMHDKHKGLDVKSEPFLMLAGSRFTEVITKTQVYDSVLSRSANMRSKDTGMKMATAFMAEPTTSINMIADALLQGKRGNKKYCRAAIGAVIASQILNSILVSFVYAGRDDDEDETYWEKYIGTLSGEVIDSLNPAGYIPFIKDIQSIVQGYDVERSDMAVVSDLWNAYQKLGSDNLSAYRKVEGFVGSIAQIFGLPVKNIMRDVRGIYQTIDSVMNGPKTTTAGIGYAVKANMPKWMGGGEVSDRNQLYEAMVSGDNAHLSRVKGRYKDASAVQSAIRMGLRENDPRIHEAAIAWNANDLDEYMRIAREVIAEKHFSQDDVVMAIRAEASKLAPDEESTTTAKSKGLFTAEKFAEAIAQDDPAMANDIKSDIIKTAQQNGKTADAAAKSFNESAKSELKEMYLAGEISEQKTVKALTTYCGADEDSALADVQYWKFKQKYPNVYADDSWFDAYYEDVADSGMDIGLYMEYRNMVKNITGGDKKEQRMAIIHSLPISNAQKDALYYAEGWAASRIGQAPWH